MAAGVRIWATAEAAVADDDAKTWKAPDVATGLWAVAATWEVWKAEEVAAWVVVAAIVAAFQPVGIDLFARRPVVEPVVVVVVAAVAVGV